MAGSFRTGSFRTVLKEVAEGLTPEDIENMKFSLPFKAAKKATIKTGFQLLGEMEEQDMIDEDEDDLQKLQELLEQYDKKKLAKTVKKFNDSKTKKDDESKKEDKLDTADTAVLSPSHITPNTQQQTMQAPPGNFNSAQYSIPCTSPAPHLIPQQGYATQNIQQHYPPGNYSSNFAPGPSPQNLSPALQNQSPGLQNQFPGLQMVPPQNQYFFPNNSAANPSMMQNGGYPSNVYHGNQMQPPTIPASMMPQSQYQQFLPQIHGQALSMPHHTHGLPSQNMTQMPNQNTTPNLPNHQAPGSKPQANEMQPNIPNTPHLHRLEDQRSESLSDNEIQDVVCDTPLAFLEGLNLNDSFGSLKSVEPVAKVPVGGRREDPMAVEADGRAVNNVPASAMYVTQPESTVLQGQPASTAVPFNHGNTPNQPAYTVQHSTPTQPESAMYGVRLREATENTKKKQDKLTEKDIVDVVAQLGFSDCERLYCELDGLSSDDVSKLKKGTDTEVDIEKEAANVFKAWITIKGSEATRQAVLTALEKCDNNLAKQNLANLWKKETGKFQVDDISYVIEEGELGPNDITNLFESLGLKQSFIDRKRKAQRSNVQQQAKLVFQGWIKKQRSTIGDILDALEEAGNKNASEELQKIWGIGKSEPSITPDGIKVTSFQQDGYELKIVSATRPEHYETNEGCKVLLPWQSEYKIHVGNNQPNRCAVIVNYDGKYAGEFELRSQGNMVIERPPFEEGKFCFVKPESASSGSGVRVDNPENGIITATFIPEKVSQPAYLNDLSRGFGQPEALASDHLECEDDYEAVEADSFPFNPPSYSVQSENDVQRSIVGGGGGPPGPPSGSDWRTGATALVGHSNQQFQAADDFKVDETKKVEITLRLVGLI